MANEVLSYILMGKALVLVIAFVCTAIERPPCQPKDYTKRWRK